jgi:hypothetical protein
LVEVRSIKVAKSSEPDWADSAGITTKGCNNDAAAFFAQIDALRSELRKCETKSSSIEFDLRHDREWDPKGEGNEHNKGVTGHWHSDPLGSRPQYRRNWSI